MDDQDDAADGHPGRPGPAGTRAPQTRGIAPELSRLVPTDRIGERPTRFEVTAEADELAPVARRLLVPELLALDTSFVLRRLPGGAFGASGHLLARVMRDCVVSLERFEERVDETFEVEFVTEDRLTEDDDPELAALIAYHGSAIDLGDASVEQLALALDPFPRRPGIVLEGDGQAVAGKSQPAARSGPGGDPAAAERPNPFAALAGRFKTGGAKTGE